MIILINISDKENDVCFPKNIISLLLHLKVKLIGIGKFIMYDTTTNSAKFLNSIKTNYNDNFDVYIDNSTSWSEVKKYLQTK